MSVGRTVEEKVGDFHTAYTLVRETLTPEAFRALTTLANKEQQEDGTLNIPTINVGMSAARIVFANDRAAAMVAVMLVANGVKPVPVSFGDEDV